MCWYFPIRRKLKKLLRTRRFRYLCMHEARRSHNRRYCTDVYDSPHWRRVMGPVTQNLERIGLQLCVDAIPAFQHGGLSVKPLEFMILSLPPAHRTQTRNMLLCMLIPSQLKGLAARKYYDWAAQYEMNDLHLRGVSGVRAIVYGTSLDAPGRAEIVQMQAHTAMFGCPHCQILFGAGLLTQCDFGGFRRFLPPGHPWRQRTFRVHGCAYMFADIERRREPTARTTQNTFECVAIATQSRPFRGHKSEPFLSRWRCFSWDMNVPDVMHDIKNVCEMILKILVGPGSHGMYAIWATQRRDMYHRLYCRVHNIFPEVHDANNPLPWRLSPAAVNELDRRVRSMWWPHYCDVLCRDGYSFWKKTCVCWKSRNKAMIFLVYFCVIHNRDTDI